MNCRIQRILFGGSSRLTDAFPRFGARLLNACAATGVAASTFATMVDSVWIDFTKGLGAPIGAVLAGSAPFVAEARRQSMAVARSSHAKEDQDFIDAISDWGGK